MIIFISVTLSIIAILCWFILASLIGLSLRATTVLLLGALWRFALFGIVAALIVYSYPAAVARFEYLSRALF